MRIILASQSPRRIELLRQFNIEFDIEPSKIDEKVSAFDTPSQAVMALSYEKAMSVSQSNEDALIIASDTVVYCDAILGKPNNEAEAFSMLKLLSGRVHYVYTGLSLVHLKSNTKIVDYEITQVHFNCLSDQLIERYINTGEPMDKAGAYGIQGVGSVLVDRICGDYFNVMGLPLSKLSLLLKKHFSIDLL